MSAYEKMEECPRCGEVKRWVYDAQMCAACDYGNRAAKGKHRARAVEAMASHLCSTDFTNGFCGPRDGKCVRRTADERPDRNCMKVAEGLMRAIETRGCKVVWAFDKEPTEQQKIENRRMAPDPFVDAAERAALRVRTP